MNARTAAEADVHVVTTVGPRDFEVVRMTVFCLHETRTVRLGECPECESNAAGPPPQMADASAPVRNIMQKDVFCVRADVTVDELVTLLVEHGFTGMPIVDEDGRPVGVVSMSDVMRHRYEQLEDEEAGFGSGGRGQAQVADLMKALPVTVEENTSLAEASRKMAQYRIHRLPVVNSHGLLVGLISALDVVAWLGREGQVG